MLGLVDTNIAVLLKIPRLHRRIIRDNQLLIT
jgi:hypothetical protein